jgi:hypothetical protein
MALLGLGLFFCARAYFDRHPEKKAKTIKAIRAYSNIGILTVIGLAALFCLVYYFATNQQH